MEPEKQKDYTYILIDTCTDTRQGCVAVVPFSLLTDRERGVISNFIATSVRDKETFDILTQLCFNPKYQLKEGESFPVGHISKIVWFDSCNF